MDVSGIEVKPEVVVDAKLDMFAKLAEALLQESEIKKLAVPVDPKIVALLKEILEKSPSALSTTFEQVLKDGKIDFADIPQLVLLATQLRNSEFPTINAESFAALVKLILNGVIDLGYVQVANKAQVLAMLDVSLTLLTTTLSTGVDLVNIRSCC